MTLLDNKVAMVTGGGSGIGRATCLQFAKEGAKVLVVDISEADGTDTVKQITALGGQAIFAKADVSNEGEIQAAVGLAVAEFGGLHVASNNAALSAGSALLADSSAEDFRKTYDITLHGVFFCMKYQNPSND